MPRATGLPLPGTPPHPLVLSPMVDVTDAAFRSVAKEWGADVTCSEMVSAVGLIHDNAAAWRHVEPWKEVATPASPPTAVERPYGVQFMTGDADEMAAAVRAVGNHLELDFVDVNLGCPAPNIMKVCAGGFLMRDPQQAGKVIRAAVRAADDVGIPRVSVKMRLGPDAARLTYAQVAVEAEAAGAAWATLHARTVEQGYSGDADWSHIARLVEHVSIPVIGNGDLREPEDVVRMREETGCAGFFIARAAMRDPTIFRRMRAALEGRPAPPAPTMAERFAVLESYLQRAEAIGLRGDAMLRRQAMRFVSGVPGAARMRGRLQSAHSVAQVREALAPLLDP